MSSARSGSRGKEAELVVCAVRFDGTSRSIWDVAAAAVSEARPGRHGPLRRARAVGVAAGGSGFRAVCAHWSRSAARPGDRGLLDPSFHPRRWMTLPEGRRHRWPRRRRGHHRRAGARNQTASGTRHHRRPAVDSLGRQAPVSARINGVFPWQPVRGDAQVFSKE
ncbi:hypothetical protein C2845_PM07G20630 [Panicum miliaceum]|uniref:Uncharacterized protein n=1 Tax=Panicum miliaceum TaxID=4540 RepID=A0A3L6SJ56_PANMI|nr:hypothetical protein C2845_PM07G20630 [Panicum miliaceum]